MSYWFEKLARKFYLHMKRIAVIDDEPDITTVVKKRPVYQAGSAR